MTRLNSLLLAQFFLSTFLTLTPFFGFASGDHDLGLASVGNNLSLASPGSENIVFNKSSSAQCAAIVTPEVSPPLGPQLSQQPSPLLSPKDFLRSLQARLKSDAHLQGGEAISSSEVAPVVRAQILDQLTPLFKEFVERSWNRSRSGPRPSRSSEYAEPSSLAHSPALAPTAEALSQQSLATIEKSLLSAEATIADARAAVFDSPALAGKSSRLVKAVSGIFDSVVSDKTDEQILERTKLKRTIELLEKNMTPLIPETDRLEQALTDNAESIAKAYFQKNSGTQAADPELAQRSSQEPLPSPHTNSPANYSANQSADYRKLLQQDLAVERERVYALYMTIATSLKKHGDAQKVQIENSSRTQGNSESLSLALATAAQAAQIKNEIDDFCQTLYADVLIDQNLKKDLTYKAQDLLLRLKLLRSLFAQLKSAESAAKEMLKYNSVQRKFDLLPDREARPGLQTFIRLTKVETENSKNTKNQETTNEPRAQDQFAPRADAVEFEIEPLFIFKKSIRNTVDKSTKNNQSFRALDRARFGSRAYLLFEESRELSTGLAQIARVGSSLTSSGVASGLSGGLSGGVSRDAFSTAARASSGLDFDPYFLLPKASVIYSSPLASARTAVWVPEDFFDPKKSEIELYRDRSQTTTRVNEPQEPKRKTFRDFLPVEPKPIDEMQAKVQKLIHEIKTKALARANRATQNILLTRITLDFSDQVLTAHFKDLSIARASSAELWADAEEQSKSQSSLANQSPYFSVTLATSEFPDLDSRVRNFSIGHISQQHDYTVFEYTRQIANRLRGYRTPKDHDPTITEIYESPVYVYLDSEGLENQISTHAPLVEALWAREFAGSVEVYVRARPSQNAGKTYYPRIIKTIDSGGSFGGNSNRESKSRYEIDNYRGHLALWVPLEELRWPSHFPRSRHRPPIYNGDFLPLVRSSESMQSDIIEVLNLSVLSSVSLEKRRSAIEQVARPSNIERILETNSPRPGVNDEATFRNRRFVPIE